MRRTYALAAALLPIVAVAVAPAFGAGAIGNGISVTPPSLSVPARVGQLGTIDVSNTTGQTMRVSVTVHPWLESATGATSPNQASTVGVVKVSTPTFVLANGVAAPVTLALASAPAGGSLYANVDVVALPTTPSRVPGSQVTYGYRIIGSLRLNPIAPRYGVRVGGVVEKGTHARGTAAIPITNTGNVLITTGGSVNVTGGSGGANGALAGVEVLPGATVDVPFLNLDGTLAAGAYRLTAAIAGSGHPLGTIHKNFTLR